MITLPAPFEAHSGEDYTVVMLPKETTETASIQLYGKHAHTLATLIAELPLMWTFIQQVGRMTHSEDPDALPVEQLDNDTALDGLIHRARAIAAPILA
jgi:hypothetical protein